jgi:two-component system cell cycle sensor histidine kinase/response regulator CckA
MNMLSLLLVEDNKLHREFTKILLNEQDILVADIHVALTLSAAVAVLSSDQHIDVIVLDLHLADSHGQQTYYSLQQLRPELPIVILSGLDDDDLALKLIKEGAQDYLIKGQITKNLLARSLRYAVERKRILEQLIANQLNLSRAEQLKSVSLLASGAAHEVKNPLAQLQLALDYLLRHHSDADTFMPQLLAAMSGAIERADSVISSLVGFSNDNHLKMDRSQLGAVIDDALSRPMNQITSAGIRLNRHSEGDPFMVACDHGHLAQAFENVITNAIQAMEGGGTLTIVTDLEVLDTQQPDRSSRVIQPLHTGDTVLVTTISDTGPGIPADKLANIFNPFFSTRPTGQASGLGLSVVRKVMDLHGGLVDIRNRPEGGCEARLTLALSAQG